MQNHIVTHLRTETDALYSLSSAAMAPRLGELACRQLTSGLATAAAVSARLAAHNAFLADPTLREVDDLAECGICGRNKRVCCDEGYTEQDGRVSHVGAVCVDCCPNDHVRRREVCTACGAMKPVGQSCICFDNGCQ